MLNFMETGPNVFLFVFHWYILQDGSILAWKFNAVANTFEPAASLKGHTLAVVTLVVGGNRIYSGSMDHTIRVSWTLDASYYLWLVRNISKFHPLKSCRYLLILLLYVLCSGMEPGKFAVHANFIGTQQCCDFCFVLGPVPFDSFIRQHRKGLSFLNFDAVSLYAIK